MVGSTLAKQEHARGAICVGQSYVSIIHMRDVLLHRKLHTTSAHHT